MTNKDAALKYARLHGFNKVILMKQMKENSEYKDSDIFIACNTDIDDSLTQLYVVKNCKVRLINTQEEDDRIVDIISPSFVYV